MANVAKARIDALKQQQADLHARIVAAEEDRRKRTGRLAERAGLFDLDVDDETLEREFSALAARLRAAGPASVPKGNGAADAAAATAARSKGKGSGVASGAEG
jgi:hypothetical protein